MASGTQNMKRTNVDNNSPLQKKKSKLSCQYGEKCYRRNPIHFSEYSHPHLEKLYAEQKDGEDIKLPPDYKAKIDAHVVVDQLQIYRDHGFGAEIQDSKTQQQKQDKCSSVTATSATTSSQVPCKQRQDKGLASVASPTTNSRLPDNDGSLLEASSPKDSKSDKRSDIRRQIHDPDDDDLPPRSRGPVSALGRSLDSSFTNSKDATKFTVPKNDALRQKESQGPSLSSASVISDIRSRERQILNSKRDADDKAGKNNGPEAKRGFAARLAAAAPYNFFLTAIRDSPPTHREPLSIAFHHLLDPSMGDLDSSLQINFMVEMDWLMEQYKEFGHEKKPLLILYGVEDDILENPKSLPSNITAKKIKPSAFGHHHTKMSLFYYKDHSLRVVVSTANLISSDWYNRTQGVWVSPACPELPPDADTRAGESPSEFKADLLRYISNYSLPALQEWMSRLRKTDFSAIRVCFVASVPGSHKGPEGEKWGHRRLGHLLRKFATIPSLISTGSKESWPIIAQCSSIGTLGPDPDAWMCGELRVSMSQKSIQPSDMPQPPPPFRVIYPSLTNVKNSHDDLLGGACLPYSRKTHEKQLWFRKFLFEWKSDHRHRTKAVPHIKSYARVSPCGKHLAWFHLTSANLSKAAWGKVQGAKGKNGTTGLYIMSYEAGVLFLPKLLVNEPVFRVNEGSKASDHNPPFPLPWDLPLSAYGADDVPWVSEYMD